MMPNTEHFRFQEGDIWLLLLLLWICLAVWLLASSDNVQKQMNEQTNPFPTLLVTNI